MTAGAARTLLAAAAAWAVALSTAYAARVEKPVGAMWVRNQQTALGGQSGAALLEFCASQQIELLFVAAPQLKAGSYQKWRAFLGRAHEQGIRVHAVAGEAQWRVVQETGPRGDAASGSGPLTGGRSMALRHVGELMAYNRAVDPRERFAGVRHDVPIWESGAPDEAGSAAEKAMMLADHVEQLWGCRHYLRELSKIGGATDGEPALFGTSIPVGFDEPTMWGKEGQFKTVTLPVSQQVMRIADYVVVNAAADTPEAIVDAAAEYVQFAGQMERRAFVGVSTAPVGDVGASATFGDGSRGDMDKVLAQAVERLGVEPGFAGVVIDCYATFSKMAL